MLYYLLRQCARVGLRWYYRSIEVDGLERVPTSGPVLVAANHANALIDALVIAAFLGRPLRMTAKATLLKHPLTRALVRAVGVVPLRRSHDELHGDALPAPERNASAFSAVLDAFDAGEVVLIFPEGISHNAPSLAPLRSGAARLVRQAWQERRLNVPVLPVGLTFERKWQPRSRVLMCVGAVLRATPDDTRELTRTIDEGLRAITLNFPTTRDAERVLQIATALERLQGDVRPLGKADPSLSSIVARARTLERLRTELPLLNPELRAACEDFLLQLDQFDRSVRISGVRMDDLLMPLSLSAGTLFVLREAGIVAVLGPLALWGRMNHWLPLTLARLVALRTSASEDDPAMRTIVSGFAFVLVWYVLVVAAVFALGGVWWSVLYVVTALPGADWNFRLGDRMHRGVIRARTYIRLRGKPQLQQQWHLDLLRLREQAVNLEQRLVAPA